MRIIFSTFILSILITVNSIAQDHSFDPPWNPPVTAPVQFTVKGIDNVPDIYGDITDPQLVVFMGGNQFMVLDELLAAFRKKHPQYQRILVETLPPGLLLQQIKKGSLVVGNMRISLQPDVYTTGKKSMEENKALFEKTRPYSATRLSLMVYKGNPENIKSLQDLGKTSLRISMPDKAIEGIGETIEEAYKKAGGQSLHTHIMVNKVKDSTTFITQIHHRQSPMRILYRQSEVAPVWETEVLYQQSLGHPIEGVAIPESYNKLSTSVAGVLKNAPHREAAHHFVDFLASKEAAAIFKKYGFRQPTE
jgi:molybdate transport system substrate-binding protein